jgi:ABC-type multidrug transport system ATPase subunit
MQASESIYNLFDRVLVLDRGRPIYFGPTKEAKQYFIDLGFECEPRKTTPDFLTGISNPQERRVRKGYEDTAPNNSLELEEAFVKSEQYAQSLRELAEYEAQIREEVFFSCSPMKLHTNHSFSVLMLISKRKCATQKQSEQGIILYIRPVCLSSYMP